MKDVLLFAYCYYLFVAAACKGADNIVALLGLHIVKEFDGTREDNIDIVCWLDCLMSLES